MKYSVACHCVRVKYKLRPAVMKLYQLRPEVSALRVSVARRVNPKHDELRPAVNKELCLLHAYEGVLISPLLDQDGNKLQRTNSGFIQHTPQEAQYTS